MNGEFLNIILIIALGYLLKRFNILQEKDGAVIAKLIFKVTLPALVIVTFNTVQLEPSLIVLPMIVLLYGVATAALGLLVFKNEERELKGSFLMLSSGWNVGLFAFPLIFAIWGMYGITYFGMYDVGASFIVFGVAYILGSYFSEAGLSLKPIGIVKKLLTSIPLMTYIIAMTLNYSNILLPESFINMAEIISAANVPLSLLLLGIYLNFRFEKQFIRPVLKFLTFRYSLGLLVGVSLYFLLPYDEMFRYTIMIGLLLPVAASPLAFAVEFNYSTNSIRLIATISNITIMVSIVILYLFSNFIL
ncbi:AEC family transporter [Halalkalibacter krulwichiae]|uniref:Membrane transport protein n=1 Tax=Halalkalibacter krulwichiae TaxID=199441 RepID=A0A1X9MFQ9_9BACI|nr:AEC family transporter [Halalkalibacter krulwichiae]ARK32246.1 Membrane transport protein [Halalkalibacter krulwichiae]